MHRSGSPHYALASVYSYHTVPHGKMVWDGYFELSPSWWYSGIILLPYHIVQSYGMDTSAWASLGGTVGLSHFILLYHMVQQYGMDTWDWAPCGSTVGLSVILLEQCYVPHGIGWILAHYLVAHPSMQMLWLNMYAWLLLYTGFLTLTLCHFNRKHFWLFLVILCI